LVGIWHGRVHAAILRITRVNGAHVSIRTVYGLAVVAGSIGIAYVLGAEVAVVAVAHATLWAGPHLISGVIPKMGFQRLLAHHKLVGVQRIVRWDAAESRLLRARVRSPGRDEPQADQQQG
jgi:hypothetical protein